MPQIRKTSFVTPLAHDVRRRHEHTRNGKIITGFVVQIEIFALGKWLPVVRYDTAHGFAHRDKISPKGEIEKTPLFMHNWTEALEFAEADLRANWQSYAERFKKELK